MKRIQHQLHSLQLDSLVYAKKNYAPGPKWLPGKTISKIGSTVFMIQTDTGIWKRYTNQLQVRLAVNNADSNSDTQGTTSPNVVCQEPEPERRYPLRIRKAPERYQS